MIGNVFSNEPTQMAFIQWDDMVEDLATGAPHPAFRDSVLPGCRDARPFVVDPSRFRGTCYRAANWLALGHTTGRGKDDREHRPNRPVKEVLVYPLHRRFREWLTA
jgi:hypothetical protein